MKARAYILPVLLLLTCGLAFGLPFLIVGLSGQTYYDPDLVIPNAGGSATATISTERALTIEAFATLFSTATQAATASLTATPTTGPSPTLLFTPTSAPTLPPSNTPPLLPSPTAFPATMTGQPRERDTPTSAPPTDPKPTNPPPTSPPPTSVPPTNPPPTSVIPPVIRTLSP